MYESEECLQVMKEIDVRLNYPFHKCTNLVSTWNTLQYLFYHMKCGIFVMIRGGSLRIFAPFVNSEYRNTWGDVIRLEGDNSLDSYYSKKSGLYREEITMTVNGFSRSNAMTGVRLGYLDAPPKRSKACTTIQSQLTSCVGSIAQVASVAASTEVRQ